MKQFFTFFFAALAFTACSSDEPAPINKGRLDPSAFVRIEAQKGVKSRSKESTDDYSALDIARFGMAMEYRSEWSGLEKVKEYQSQKTFLNQRDTLSANPALLMFGTDIINSEGRFNKSFLFARDVVIFGLRYQGKLTTYGDRQVENDDPEKDLGMLIGKYGVKDTIAYIPNSVMREAQGRIEKAYNEGNYTEVYKLFHETFRFRPITGKKWRELKAQGLN